MNYLLDTCSFLWLAEGNTRLSQTARSIIEDSDNDGAVSAVSFWELSMKSVVGKLPLLMAPADLERLAIQNNIDVLPLTVSQIDRFHRIPATHRDAFDRLLAAVALANDYTLITPDSVFDSLGVLRVW